jgi:hypothetical protein
MVFENAQIEDEYNEEFRQSIPWDDPIVRIFIEEYYQNKTIPLLLKLYKKAKQRGGSRVISRYRSVTLKLFTILMYKL